jgi:hypothetical protein
MPERPSEQDMTMWHRRFAAEANDRAWTLSERADLEVEEKTELVYAAYAAAHHWSKVGTHEQVARAELLLGRVHALLGHGDLAMRFATVAFKSITSRESAPWEVALAHAILANAAAASGDHQVHGEHYAKAKTLGEGLSDLQEKDLFLATFNLIPMPDTSSGTS